MPIQFSEHSPNSWSPGTFTKLLCQEFVALLDKRIYSLWQTMSRTFWNVQNQKPDTTFFCARIRNSIVSRVLCCAGERSVRVASQLRPKQTCWPVPDLERPLRLAVSPA